MKSTWLSVSLALVLGCPKPVAGPDFPRDIYLWQLSHADKQVGWLLGSVHFAPQGFELDAALVEAFDAADSLAVELDIDAISMRDLMHLYGEVGVYSDGRTLVDEIGEADFERLTALLRTRGVALANLERLKPWVVTLMLNLLASTTTGGGGGQGELGMGVDRYFLARAKAGEKTIHSLETIQEQMEAFSAAVEDLQIEQLRRTLSAVSRGESPIQEVIDTYAEGDVEQLVADEAEAAADDERMRAYNKRILDDRNVKMVERIEKLIKEGSRPLVIVGAAHMYGPVGLVELLKKAGYNIEPVPPTGKKVTVAPPPESDAALPDVRVVDHSVDWPMPPVTQTVNVQGNEIDVTTATQLPVQYVLSKTTLPRAMVLSLDRLYEQSRITTERDLQVRLSDSQTIEVSGVEANRFVAANATIEVHAVQVWADGKVYVLLALVPPTVATDSMRAEIARVLESFSLHTYTSEEAAANRRPALELLETRPGWLFPHEVCPKHLALDANERTRTAANPCSPNLHACLVECEKGDAFSCMRAGDDLMAQQASFDFIGALYVRACLLGLTEGCTSHAAHLLFEEEEPWAWECGKSTLETACDHQDPWACAIYGTALLRGRGVEKDLDMAKTFLERACSIESMSQACKHARQMTVGLERGMTGEDSQAP